MDSCHNTYDASLCIHGDLGGKEQPEYEGRIKTTALFFQQNITFLSIDLAAGNTAKTYLSNETHVDVVLACDFQMGNFMPHWGQTAPPGKLTTIRNGFITYLVSWTRQTLERTCTSPTRQCLETKTPITCERLFGTMRIKFFSLELFSCASI